MSFLKRMLDHQFKADNNLPTNGFWLHNGPEEEIDFVVETIDCTNDTIELKVINHSTSDLIDSRLTINLNTPFMRIVPKREGAKFRLFIYPSDATTGARFDAKVLVNG